MKKYYLMITALCAIYLASPLMVSCMSEQEHKEYAQYRKDLVEKPAETMPEEVVTWKGHEYVKFNGGTSSWGGHSASCPNKVHQCKCDTSGNR